MPDSPAAAPDSRDYVCPWCKHRSNASTTSCPSCGAPIDVRSIITRSGWMKLPPITGMTKLQFGHSSCQIQGNYVPVADFNLVQGDGIYFTHHVLLWKDPKITITRMPLTRAFTRFMAGLPLIMTQALGPGHIAFSKDKPGELIAVPLDAGQSIDVREHVFMAASIQVSYDWFDPHVYFDTYKKKDETERHFPIGMFLDRFTAPSLPGLLLLHGEGNVFVRNLKADQSVLIKPTSFLFKDPTVTMNLNHEQPGNRFGVNNSFFTRTYYHRHMWLQLNGPGRVAVQSNYPPFEDEGLQVSAMSQRSTTTRW